jgi:hypothetical protein
VDLSGGALKSVNEFSWPLVVSRVGEGGCCGRRSGISAQLEWFFSSWERDFSGWDGHLRGWERYLRCRWQRDTEDRQQKEAKDLTGNKRRRRQRRKLPLNFNQVVNERMRCRSASFANYTYLYTSVNRYTTDCGVRGGDLLPVVVGARSASVASETLRSAASAGSGDPRRTGERRSAVVDFVNHSHPVGAPGPQPPAVVRRYREADASRSPHFSLDLWGVSV